MDKKYLVLWEVSQKQKYIFSTNRLKENRGASIIIENIVSQLPKSIDPSYGENLVYNGGGSSLYYFKREEETREFIKKVSRKVLKTYPGVEVFMAYKGFNPRREKISQTIDSLYEDLEKKKSRREHAGGRLSYGIERLCVSTKLPASKIVDAYGKKRAYSEESLVKIRESEKNSDKFKELVPSDILINEFEDLIGDGKNYIGVVHIDGNKMGLKFNKLKDYYKFEGDDYLEENKRYIENLKDFSKRIEDSFESAFKYMTDTINSQLNREKLEEVSKIDQGKFPLIPIIVAGDDISYVVNGSIAIDSARLFLEYLDQEEIEIYPGEKVDIKACAGVAIVRTGYPFSKAYELAESLCENSKKKLREDYGEEEDYCLIDWHIDQGDIFGSIEEIRKEYYRARDGKYLNMRPLYINNQDKWRNFDNFLALGKELSRTNESLDQPARNKIKQLREVLRRGENETEIYLKSYALENNFAAPLGIEGSNYCFNGDRCMYYDLLETMDFYVNLEN